MLAAAASWQWPLIAKPRCGSAGIGVVHCASVADLPEGDVVVQELAPGAEHTVDVLVLRDGRCRVAVPRRRIEVRAGEVAKGVTVRHAAARGARPQHRGDAARRLRRAQRPGLRGRRRAARDRGQRPLRRRLPARLRGGARLPEWTIEELLGRPSTVSDDWREGLVMLRYDEAVFVDAAAIPSASSAYQLG